LFYKDNVLWGKRKNSEKCFDSPAKKKVELILGRFLQTLMWRFCEWLKSKNAKKSKKTGRKL